MRCCGTTRNGMRCRWPAETMAGGIAVCKFHIRQATAGFAHVKSKLGDDHPVIMAAERDTRQINAERQRQDALLRRARRAYDCEGD